MTSSHPRLKLVYLGVRGLGEPLRLMARYTKYTFTEDITIPGPEFRVMKMNDKAVHSRSEQLPALHVRSETKTTPLVISQSGACMRYLAGVTGHMPVSLEQRARADAVFDTAQELFAVNPLANVFPVGAERDAKEKDYFGMAFRRRLRFCERLLDEAKDESGTSSTSFFGGHEPYYGDFQLFHMLDLSLAIKPNCLDKAPSVKAFMDEMYALPAVSAYLKERPQLGTQSIGYEGSRMYDGV